MAVYFLRSQHVSRANGSRVTRAAAYRAGERIRDERSSEVYDHSDRRDVAYKEVVLPEELVDRPDMAWAKDRASLWNAAGPTGFSGFGSASPWAARAILRAWLAESVLAESVRLIRSR